MPGNARSMLLSRQAVCGAAACQHNDACHLLIVWQQQVSSKQVIIIYSLFQAQMDCDTSRQISTQRVTAQEDHNLTGTITCTSQHQLLRVLLTV